MTLDEIAFFFKDSSGEAIMSFKDFCKGGTATSTFITEKADNYILGDTEKLLDKAILNMASCDFLIREGYFSWGYITAYYSSFFSLQALNRLQLNFKSYGVKCALHSLLDHEVIISKHTSEKTHQEQFEDFKKNRKEYLRNRSIDRYWNIGLDDFDELNYYRDEVDIRNKINYHLLPEKEVYKEFELSDALFSQIVVDNKKSPFTTHIEQVSDPFNYSRRGLKICIGRIRVLCHTLNYIAARNAHYKSYYDRNMRRRMTAIKSKYPEISDWIESLLEDWLI